MKNKKIISEETRKKISKANKGRPAHNKGKKLSEETRKKMSEARKGHPTSEETRNKISIAAKGRKQTNETKEKLSKLNTGKKLSDETKNKISTTLKGRTFSAETIENYRKAAKIRSQSPEYIKKLSKAATGKICSIETRQKLSEAAKIRNSKWGENHPCKREDVKLKLRLNAIERLSKIMPDCQLVPSFNLKACECFDKIMKEKNIIIQHALNGGEYHIKELGYWVDGYDKENNVVYEYDEKHHYSLNKLKNKDVQRQKEIEQFLGCTFIRIKE